MKILAIHLREPYKPVGAEVVSVVRAVSVDGRPGFDIQFEAGFYTCRKAGMRTFRIPASNVKADEVEEESPRAKATKGPGPALCSPVTKPA